MLLHSYIDNQDSNAHTHTPPLCAQGIWLCIICNNTAQTVCVFVSERESLCLLQSIIKIAAEVVSSRSSSQAAATWRRARMTQQSSPSGPDCSNNNKQQHSAAVCWHVCQSFTASSSPLPLSALSGQREIWSGNSHHYSFIKSRSSALHDIQWTHLRVSAGEWTQTIMWQDCPSGAGAGNNPLPGSDRWRQRLWIRLDH